MTKNYFNMGTYDNMFFDKIMERGTEIYLSDKIIDFKHKDNKYSCKIKGNDIYDVEVSFHSNNDEIDNISCTCPFVQDGNHCKHMYALLLKIKCNYNLENITSDINNESKQVKTNLKRFNKEMDASLKYKNDILVNELDSFKRCFNIYKCRYEGVIKEYKKNEINNLITLKKLITLNKDIENALLDFNTRLTYHKRYFKEKTKVKNDTKSFSLFGLFMDALKAVEDADRQSNIELEQEKQRYRDAIIEQNLSDGKMYEDLYHELNGDDD